MKKDPKLIFLPVPVALQYRDYLASRSFLHSQKAFPFFRLSSPGVE